MRVEFMDVRSHHIALERELDEAIHKVIECSSFSGGHFVEHFEEQFAGLCDCDYAIGLGSGTEALWLTLLALGVGPGDEVITVPMTFLATAEAISFTGGRPIFVDIDPLTYTMDPAKLESAITPKTKAIIPVHLFGQCADMDPILEIARKFGVPVIEDACQAHGAEYNRRLAGSMGVAGCFSFYPGKNLGAFGEAGAVSTNDPELRKRIQILRDHGQRKKYHHSHIGWNARMDGIQAAVLSVKLPYLQERNAQRRTNARLYNQLLHGYREVITPGEADSSKHVYHLYVVRLQERDRILSQLAEQGVICGIHYPIPVHLQEAYRGLGLEEGSFPVAEQCAKEFLSLPMFPELDCEQIERVVESLTELSSDTRSPTISYAGWR